MLQAFTSLQLIRLMTPVELIPLFGAPLVLFIAFIVLLEHRRSLLHILFGLISCCIAVWLIGSFMVTASGDIGVQLFWVRFIYLGIAILPMLLYQFGATFAQIKIPRPILALGYSIAAFFLVISQTDYFITSLAQFKWGLLTTAHFSHHIFLIFFFYFSIRGILYVFHKYKHAYDVAEKLRARYVLIAFIALYALGSLSFLTVYGIPIFLFSYFGGILFVLLMYFAIAKHKLFNLKAATAEVFIFFIVLFFLWQIFVATSSELRTVYGMLFAFFIAFSFIFIQSIITEFNQRAKLEQLTAQLEDLNTNLQKKVDEQTGEIRRAYEVEKKARVELEELDKAKDEFILTAQHHLRTPLAIIKWSLQSFLSRKTVPVDAAGISYLEKASSATDQIILLVNELLDVAQMKAGQSTLKKEPIDLRTLTETTLDEFSHNIAEKHLKISLNFSVQENENIVNVDKKKIREAIYNIIDNAIKYNKEGGEIIIKGEAIHHPIEKGVFVYRLTIADTGIGISSDELPRLFTQYFSRGGEAKKIYATGRGIGLMLVKNAVNAHGGRIYAESKGKGRGSKFVMELPL